MKMTANTGHTIRCPYTREWVSVERACLCSGYNGKSDGGCGHLIFCDDDAEPVTVECDMED